MNKYLDIYIFEQIESNHMESNNSNRLYPVELVELSNIIQLPCEEIRLWLQSSRISFNDLKVWYLFAGRYPDVSEQYFIYQFGAEKFVNGIKAIRANEGYSAPDIELVKLSPTSDSALLAAMSKRRLRTDEK